MIKAQYIGTVSYKTAEFHASPGNTVFMSNTLYNKLSSANKKKFKVLLTNTTAFPPLVTRLPGWK